MATKWKNNKNRMKEFLKHNYKLFIAVVLMMIGGILFYTLVVYHSYYVTKDAWLLTVGGNVTWLLGTALLWSCILRYKLKDFLPEDETCYEQWKQRKKQHIQRLQIISLVEWILACAYLFLLTYERRYGGYYSVSNYASGYAMIITVLNQYIACRWVISHEMQRKMDDCMQYMANVSKERIDQALEIEREGLKKAMEIERQSMEKVSRSDQLRIDLITNVSHDLKTPLTSMVGYMELMRKEELNDTVRDYLDVITDKAAKLKEMIESLFSLAKASSGNIEFHMETLELNRLVEQIYGDMEDKIADSGLKIVTSLTEKDTKLVSDNMYLYRICQNLLENALKYSAKGTRVFVKTFYRSGIMGDQLCLEVTNTAGYPMDFQKEDIIERFARADQSRTTEGNGLGLAIVSTYASALGGAFDIDIDCDQFKAIVTFPIMEQEETETCEEDGLSK